MNKQNFTVFSNSTDTGKNTSMQEKRISERDLPTALAFLARILDEMHGVHQNCAIQGEDSLISYDEACMAYKALLIKSFSA